MIKNSTIIHLRFPFSIFLLPIYLFALSQSPEISVYKAILVFVILHLLVYPASNGYNSYFDKDEGSIGGVKTPPEVSRELYKVSLILDGLALALSLLAGWQFALGILVYGLTSKAYSHPIVRLKKYPVIGWLTIGLFQGFLTYLISLMAINEYSLQNTVALGWKPAVLASLLLLGSYPMTQIYQHKEDAARGDFTLSYRLGIVGTFHFTGVLFTLATAGFISYFLTQDKFLNGLLFLIFLLPTILFFLNWYIQVRRDREKADYRNTMKLNLISSVGLCIFFLLITVIEM